jgi:hypothetical protein
MTKPPVLMLDKQLLAARAMLAALKEIKRTNQHYNFGSKLLRIVDPAIAAAKAAGIEESTDT